jgi:hypothetical protein
VKLGVVFAAAVAALAVAGSAEAAGPSTATVNSQITIVTPTLLTGTRDLEFGTIAKPTTGTTTVTVASAASATATPSVSGGNGFIPTPGLAHASTFHLVGAANETYSVSANTLTFTGSAGNLTAVGAEAPVAASNSLLTLPASGTDDLFIGGHFDITSATASQVYSGTLSLTINFN